MLQEDKELLLKDLCARLPYDIKVSCNDKVYNLNGIQYFNICTLTDENENNAFTTSGLKYIKPYLFPLSSMTEEQYNEMHNYCYNAEREASKFSNGELKLIYNYELFKFDYLNRNHFDWRGLIPMGLANDATGLNIY